MRPTRFETTGLVGVWLSAEGRADKAVMLDKGFVADTGRVMQQRL